MTSDLIGWAIRNRVSQQALAELKALFNLDPVAVTVSAGKDESYVQSLVRLEAARKGLKLWRNNVGVLTNDAGVPVRYGLANDSKRLNETVKSGDLIGWRPLVITPAMVGGRIAQFVSRECKRPDWRYTGTDRERAQLRWIEAVVSDGGDAKFCNSEGTL